MECLKIAIFYLYLIQFGAECLPFDVYRDNYENLIPSLTVEYSGDLKNGDNVTVRWTGIRDQAFDDQIRIYCPPSMDDAMYVRRYSRSNYPSMGSSSGQITVPVFYTRTTCEFRYLKKIRDKVVAVLRSNELVFGMVESDPTQIHIALTGRQNSMRISWVSGSNLLPCVQYGNSEEALVREKCGSTETYKADDMCGPMATTTGFLDPGYLHSVVLDDLDSDRVYYYVVGNSERKSMVQKMTSPPDILRAQPKEITIAAFGDSDVTPFPGAYGTMQNMLNYMGNDKIDIVLHVGDISYSMGRGYVWEEFGYMIQPVAARVPYMMTIGNHEHNHIYHHERDPSRDGPNFQPVASTYIDDSGGECAVPMYYRYKMPHNGNSLFWYSYDYGIVHLIALSSENNFMKGSNQYRWFEQDLASVDRKITPWVIVTIHRSLYISVPPSVFDPASDLLRDELEPLLIKYRVNFVITGHYHSYERTCPVNNGTCADAQDTSKPWGTVHLTVGTGGRLIGPPLTIPNSWSLATGFSYGLGYLKILNEHKASWTFVENINNLVTDSATYEINI